MNERESRLSGVAGMLLTGGASRRMGFDKATMLIDGEVAAERLAAILAAVAVPVIEVGPGVTSLADVAESPLGGGPLAAVASGGRALRTVGHLGPALVVACDLPLLTAGALQELAEWPDACSVVPVAEGRPQPLCARWSAQDLETAERIVAGGARTMGALVELTHPVLVDVTSADGALNAAVMVDLDSPEDAARLGLDLRRASARASGGRGGAAAPRELATSARYDQQRVLTPPVGGDWIAITEESLPTGSALEWLVLPGCGAVTMFCGTVRDHTEGRPPIVAIDYEAYREQVVARLTDLAAAARARWPMLGRLVLLHRVGRLGVGDVSVVVAVSTPHRADSFEVARYLIDTLKQTVPIWKKEHWEGGSDWALGEHELVELEGD